MNTKRIPAIITLAAAAITCAVSILQGVSFGTFTVRFLCSVLIFLVIGSIIKIVIDYSFKVIDEEKPEENIDGDNIENLENIDSFDDNGEESASKEDSDD